MNVLITGCAGFIGSNLAQKLLDVHKDVVIIGIDNFDKSYQKEQKDGNLSYLNRYKNFLFYEGDIRDSVLLDKIFKANKIDIIIHLAAKAGVRASFENEQEYKSVNIDGTLSILEKAAEYKIKKFIFASSSSVYGNNSYDKFNEELQNLVPISPYAETKLIGEKLVKQYSEKYGINSLCLRFFTVYGKNQRPDLAICKFTKQIINNEPVVIYGDGNTYRDYTYIDDLIDGIIQAIEYNETSYEIINLGSSKPIKLTDMVRLLEKEIGKKAEIKYTEIPRGDVIKTYADISKAKKLLSYKPKIDFEQGLHKFVQYFLFGKH